ncbi:oligosaccharide flippase family protein [Cellulomonas hominis]|uniref:oligosaccharide flippase family protein n=1 Tax=Cellulomonas hominis TaxID=156981 RepID=UPI001B96FDBA|nr:oligosaccharide flippase family protein [Cellulomonas hominis]VTR76321.1 hypothetical protein CHMI_01078 [Cellulomonas hominis]
MTGAPGLGRQVGRGLAWGSAGGLVLRFGNVLVGIVLARLLAPEDFGVFALALAVQGVLVTVVDLGLSADLVRSKDPRRLEPTVATLSLASGVLLAGAMALGAEPVARALGSEQAAPVIAVLAVTLVVSAAGVVPYARMQRDFQQREIFATGLVDLVVGTVVTLALVLAGWGPMALAVSRLVAQPCATADAGAGADGGLSLAVRLTWAGAVPVACLLGVLSGQVVVLLYGDRWLPAAAALTALAAFGAVRVLFDLMATYLIARGSTRPVLGIQVVWLVVLVPALVLGARWWGSAGVGWAHVAVALAVVLPLYLVAVRRSGADLRGLAAATWLPLVAAPPTVAAALLVSRLVEGPVPGLLLGGLAGALVYAALVGRPLLRDLRASRRARGAVGAPDPAPVP